jgi:hypothetical protein
VIEPREFECRICIPRNDEDYICEQLRKALPALRWETGDSSWDKIRVWGQTADIFVRVYRYESPGPFLLTVRLGTPEASSAESEFHALRDTVLAALDASIVKPLEPQPVSLIRVDGRFPVQYAFECTLGLAEIHRLLSESDFSVPAGTASWYWSWFGYGTPSPRIECRARWDGTERILISGDAPHFRLDVGHWSDQVHEAVQTTILPALNAHNVRALGGEPPTRSRPG